MVGGFDGPHARLLEECVEVRVLFVSDSRGSPAPGFGRAHADTDLVEALESSGIEVARADWSDLARGAVDLEHVDLVHLRPAVLRRGPRAGDRRSQSGRMTFGRRHAERESDGPGDRRTATSLLAHVPLELPIVLTLPTPPVGPVAVPVPAVIPVEPAPGAPGSRAVHVIAADVGGASGLDAVLPDTHAASVAVIGRGFGEPPRARAFDVESAVVLAMTSPGSAREAAAVLRAVEMLGHAGLRFSLVLAGVGPTVRGVQRRVALAEAAGIDVRLLGRASSDELARWRATASACAITSCEPGAEREVADVLLSGLPVVATLDPVHAEVAAQTTVPPGWFAVGDSAGLAARLLECLPTADPVPESSGRSERARAGGSGPVTDAAPDGSRADPGGGLAVLARVEPATPGEVGSGQVTVGPVEVRPGDRVLPTWADIADQTRWVYQQALRRRRG